MVGVVGGDGGIELLLGRWDEDDEEVRLRFSSVGIRSKSSHSDCGDDLDDEALSDT